MARELVIEMRDGESQQALALRIRAASDGRPVMAMPKVFATTDEWIEQCRRHGYPAGRATQ